MSISTEENELEMIIDHICDYLSQLIVATTTTEAAILRRQISQLRSFGLAYLADKTFGTKLNECFITARGLDGVNANRVALVRAQLYNEVVTGPIAILVLESAILFCLTTECILITRMTFKSSDAVQVMMKRMKIAFDQARDQAADRMDSATYQDLTYLAGSLNNHLSRTALQLPRLVQFHFQAILPSLTLSHKIYQVATRSDELIEENEVVHPLFMPLDIKGYNA